MRAKIPGVIEELASFPLKDSPSFILTVPFKWYPTR